MSSDWAVAGPSTKAPPLTETALSTVSFGSVTVVVAVAGLDVSSNPVGMVPAAKAPSWSVRLLATVTVLTAVWPRSTFAPPLRWVARTWPL